MACGMRVFVLVVVKGMVIGYHIEWESIMKETVGAMLCSVITNQKDS